VAIHFIEGLSVLMGHVQNVIRRRIDVNGII
jgi:hypothetical protein